jgi:hypothetical protein
MRRTQTLHPAALLVDQDRRVAPAGDVAKLSRQINNLARTFDVPCEQDQAPRLEIAQKCTFLIADPCRSKSGDECTGCHAQP